MSEDEIRQYLGRGREASPPQSQPAMRVARRARPRPQPESYKDFSATHLFCPRCQQATPVRESVMLYLSDGNLHNYSCTHCGTSVGTRKAGS